MSDNRSVDEISEFRAQKKDLISIGVIIAVLVISMIFLQIFNKKYEFIEKISQKIGSKYIK